MKVSYNLVSLNNFGIVSNTARMFTVCTLPYTDTRNTVSLAAASLSAACFAFTQVELWQLVRDDWK